MTTIFKFLLIDSMKIYLLITCYFLYLKLKICYIHFIIKLFENITHKMKHIMIITDVNFEIYADVKSFKIYKIYFLCYRLENSATISILQNALQHKDPKHNCDSMDNCQYKGQIFLEKLPIGITPLDAK